MKLHQSKLTGRQRDKAAGNSNKWRKGELVSTSSQEWANYWIWALVTSISCTDTAMCTHTRTDRQSHTAQSRAEQNRTEQNRQFKALDTMAERPAGLDVLEKLIKWSDLHYSQVLISITKLKWAKAHEQHTGWTGTDTQTHTRTHSCSVRASPGEFQPFVLHWQTYKCAKLGQNVTRMSKKIRKVKWTQ